MTENMQKFLEAISRNEELHAKASSMDMAALIAAAKALGIELTETDFEPPAGEMSEDELDDVTGGLSCACFVGGGGIAERACACVSYGEGHAPVKDYRCCCAMYGQGNSYT